MLEGYGKLQVYTGNGKGKTTAALGVALRAAGYGAKTLMVQLMKDDRGYGEYRASAFLPGFTLRQFGRDCFVNFQAPEQIDLDFLHEGWNYAKEAILAQTYDLVIIDELNIALAYKLLPVAEVLEILSCKRGHTEVIVTGRYAPKELMDAADLVTEMQEIKHYFFAGVRSRDGIDH